MRADTFQELRVRLPRKRKSLWLRLAVVLVLIGLGAWWWSSRTTGEPASGAQPPVAEGPGPLREVAGGPGPSKTRGSEAGAPTTEPAPPPPSADELARLLTAATAEIEKRRTGDADELRRTLGLLAIDERYPANVRETWLAELRELTKRVVFSQSPMRAGTTTQVIVKDGDNLVNICARLKRERKLLVTPRLLELVNDVSPAKLRPKTPLKIPTEAISILVDKDAFRLYLLLGGVPIRDWRIGIGRDERTPEGQFVIQQKTVNPVWTDPQTGRVYQFGEPGHLIGSRWLGFGNESGRTGFGIHGTIAPESIGRTESAGCVRMLKLDVEELYDLCPTGTPVLVRR